MMNIIKKFIGKHITIFVKESGPRTFSIEIANSKRRKRLLSCEVERITSIRFRLKRR